MRKFLVFGGLTLVGFSLLIQLTLAGAGHGYATPDPASTLPYTTQTAIPSAAGSVPAPDPLEQFRGRPQSAVRGSTAITLPVTESRVLEYLTEHASSGGVIAKNTRIDSVQFMTVGQLKPLMNNDPYLNDFPESEPVVYVLLSGDFTAPSMDDINPGPVVHTMYRVFSVRTGNDLMGGVK
jgi:hypothetical protein